MNHFCSGLWSLRTTTFVQLTLKETSVSNFNRFLVQYRHHFPLVNPFTHMELITWSHHNMIRMIISVLKSTGIISSCSHTAAAQNIYRYMQQSPTLHSRLSAPASNSTLNALKIQAGIQIKVFENDKKREKKKNLPCIFLSSSSLFPLRRSSNGGTVCISMRCFCFPDRGNFFPCWINE